MKRWLLLSLGAVVLVGGGVFAYLWFAGGSGEPSTELTTPPIATETTQTGGTATTEGTGGAVTFVIDPSQSLAVFEIDEVLNGSPKHVVGSTDQVAGQVEVDFSDPSSARFSAIVINARTFTTDSERRDRAIRGPVILNSASDEFEFITFEVTSIEGIEGAMQIGESIDFTVTGDLTIRDTTNPVTFEVTMTAVDDTTVAGAASAQVLRSDFGIGIPSVASVADVTDEVLIRLEFTATA
jgi:polyisoprenoid-binding protein YceI